MKFLYTFIFSFCAFIGFGQIVANPYTGSIDLTPNSGIDGTQGSFDCGQNMQASFNLGVSGLEDAEVSQAQLTFTVGIVGWEYVDAVAGQDASSLISGSFSNLFTYVFSDTNTILATQISDIPATGPNPLNPIQGDIIIDLHVPTSSTTGDNLAINVNLQVPGYFNGNVQADDNESTTGDVVCPAGEIHGTVYVTGRADGLADSTFQGVQIYLYDVANNMLDSMLTNEFGAYAFTGLSDGEYYVTQIQPSNFSSVSDQDMSPEVGDIVDLIDSAINGLPVNDTIPILLSVDEVDIMNDFVEQPMAALPIILSQFTAHPNDCEVQVKWATNSEVNASHMILQISKDGRRYENLEQINAQGRSSAYQTTISDLSSGKYFIRLMQVDLDGSKEYSLSRTVWVESCEKDEVYLSLYPNPVVSNGILNIEYNDSKISTFTVVNQNGQVIKRIEATREPGSNYLKVDLDNFSPAVYFLISDTGRSTKFIVTN